MRSEMVGAVNNFGFIHYGSFNTRSAPAAPVEAGISASARSESLTTVFRHARSLRSNVAALEKAFGASDLKAVELQGNAIGLNFTESASRISSTEEVNPSPNSYDTHAPTLVGASTSQVTIDGDYDGDQGTDTLRFQVTRAGVVGSSRIDLRWYDSGGSSQGSFRIQSWHDPGRVYNLSNNLRVSFSAGSMLYNDEFYVGVSDTVGTTSKPDNPLNGTRGSDPDLEWGEYVRDGSFKVNGETINVLESDSINDVLGKINASAAGVTATFDTDADSVRLVNNDYGDADIVLSNDSSRFLRATKLDGASAVLGTTADDRAVIDTVAPLSGISSGTVRIGNTNVAVDVSSDSLQDVIERINTSGAGVTASLNRTTGRFRLQSNQQGTDVLLDDQGTNLFGTLGLLNGTHRAQGGPPSRKISEILADIGKDINAIFDPRLAQTDILNGLRNGIRTAFGTTVEDDGPKDLIKTGFGFGVDFREGRTQQVKFGDAEARKLRSSIRRGSLESKRFFTHGTGKGGKSLLESLGALTKGADDRILAELGPRGLYVNLVG